MELNRNKYCFRFLTSIQVSVGDATTYWGSVPGLTFELVAFDLPTPVVFYLPIVFDLPVARKESFELLSTSLGAKRRNTREMDSIHRG